MSNAGTSDLSNLDFLRSVAVLLVLCDHLLAKFHIDHVGRLHVARIGHFGVLLFFVHTSLVLMYSLDRTRLSGPALLANFYIRRIFRIYPLSIVAVCITILLGLSSAGGHGLVPSPAPSAGLVTSNLLLVQNLTRSTSILGPLWSLPLELQMYVFLPFLFLLVCWAGGKRAVWHLVGLWLAAAIVAHFYLRAGVFEQLNLIAYVPNFLPGVLAFAIGRAFGRNWRFSAALWPGYVLLLVAVYLAKPTVVVGWMLCLLLGFSISGFRELTNRALCWISKQIATYSYGIYLAHSFCVWLGFSVLLSYPLPVRIAAFLVSIIVLPVFLYHTIEHPMLQFGSRLAAKLTMERPRPAPVCAETEQP